MLAQRVRQLRGRVIRIGLGASVAWGLAAALACLIVGGWLDLVFELSPALRIGVAAVSLVVGVVLLVAVVAGAWRTGRTDLLARRMDEVGSTRGQIRSGIDLLRDGRSRSQLTEGLAEMAVERAARLANGVAARDAVPMGPLTRAVCGLSGVGAIIVAVVLIARPMAAAEYWRFIDPFGDHPPYSRVSFQVEPGNADVVYGANQEIKVTTSGPPLDRLDLVLRTPVEPGPAPGAAPEEVLPMFGEPDGVWRATVAGVTTPMQYFVRADAGRSYRYRLDVITVPKLEAVRFRITPPAYTHRGAYEGAVPQGGLAGLPGTTVQVWAKSNRPLGGGRLEITGGRPASVSVQREMTPVAAGEHEVTADFEIREPGRLEIRVRDVAGQESREAFGTSIAIRPDERPFVRLLDPPAVSLATPDVVVPVALAAEDDYGIAVLSLYRSLNDSRALPADLPVPSPPPSRYNHAVGLPVPTYGLRPGDEIKLFARVEDNDPAGAKGSESPVATVRIISQEDYQRLVITRQGLEVLQAKYEEARRRMEDIARQIEELQKELDKLPAESPLADEMRKKIDELADRMQKEAEEIAKLADTDLPFDIDKKMKEHMKELSDKLKQAAQEVKEFARQEPPPQVGEAKEGLEAIAKFCKGGKQDYEEKTTEPLEQFARIYPLLEDQSRFVALYQRQKELADRLDSLRGKDTGDDPLLRGRMRDLESEQYKVREDLRNLLADIEDHIQRLPEDDPKVENLRDTATAFVAGVKESGATEAMADAEAGLAAFSGTRGAEGAREAERILNQFIGRCNSMGGQAGTCLKFAPNLSESLGNTVEQLLAGAGLNMGANGIGGGSGYSAQSTSLDNVGLFGRLPTLGGDMGREGRDARSAALKGRGGHEGNFEGGEPGRVDPLETLRAAGAGQTVVPPQYRERVGAYFERIADEVGDKGEKVRSEK
ncbi:MAG: hypothetical protein HY718_16045 [Planctomycetes bacterium]|nr:hypothetical protein [Planctomycetota bacterium]